MTPSLYAFYIACGIVWRGGRVEQTTVGEARAMPEFLPAECPHEPRGWEVER